MKYKPHACKIQNLPPGTMCAFRGFTIGDIKAHEREHADSIDYNKRTKSRYFEVPVPLLEMKPVNYHLQMISDTSTEFQVST